MTKEGPKVVIREATFSSDSIENHPTSKNLKVTKMVTRHITGQARKSQPEVKEKSRMGDVAALPV